MWARISFYQGSKDKLEEARRFLRGDTTVSRMKGFKKAYFLADKSTGRAFTMTLWDSQEAMKASAQGVQPVRARINDVLGGTQGPTIEEFELLEEINPGSGIETMR